ncbi:tripartite tricarboxylate transporter TctB family protein [uncultured Roseibium sp.]|uniref:tripartite tricarboxylate transporter TctB family protein n=1 Tax=uncultured Roseibium sp. TaxID=1936171 RepID=UPI003216C355
MTLHTPTRDYSAAAVVTAFGTGLAALSSTYPLGSMLRPGPGFFPLVVGLLIAGLGIVIAVETWFGTRYADEGPPDEGTPAPARFAIRPVLAVFVGMIAFALLVDRAGYVAASIALVFISALGEPRSNWLTVAGVAAFMALFGVLLFIWGLGLPVNAFGPR